MVIMPNFVAIDQAIADIAIFHFFFQNHGRQPSIIFFNSKF